MRNKKNKHLGIEIDPELHYKLHYISKYYGRSANGQILYLIRQEIKAFEQNEGEIEIPEQNKADWFLYFLHISPWKEKNNMIKYKGNYFIRGCFDDTYN